MGDFSAFAKPACSEVSLSNLGEACSFRRCGPFAKSVYATAGFGVREIASVINAATMHNAPAAKNAGRYVAQAVRDTPAPNAAVAAPI